MLVGLAAIHHHNANLGRFSHVFPPCRVLHILGHSLIRAMAHRPVTIRLLQNPPNSAGWAPVDQLADGANHPVSLRGIC